MTDAVSQHSLAWLAKLRALPAWLPALDAGLPATPEAPPPRSEVATLDAIVEGWIANHPDRKGSGLFLTPRPVAVRLVQAALSACAPAATRPRGPLSVWDPAVGAGVFLDAVLEILGRDTAVHGTDCDPMAVASTRLLLATAHGIDPAVVAERIVLGDSLTASTGETSSFDLVVGNPPFGNAIEARTKRTGDQAEALRRLFPETARGPYDRAVPFVRVAAARLNEGGVLALLIPRALLAARYAEGLRGWMAMHCPPVGWVRFEGDRACPDAQIAMVGLVARRGRGVTANGSAVRRTWGPMLDPFLERMVRTTIRHPRIGDFCTVRAGASVMEAYRLVGEIVEEGTAHGWRFLTAGAVERGAHLWGARPLRHLGKRFERPILPFDAPTLTPVRASLYRRRKVVVSGLSRVLEAVLDDEGRYAGGVGTLLVLDSGERGPVFLRRVLLLLNSAWCATLHHAWRGPLALAGGNLSATKADIADLPLPRPLVDLPPGECPLDSMDPFDDDEAIQGAIARLAGLTGEDQVQLMQAWSAYGGGQAARAAMAARGQAASGGAR